MLLPPPREVVKKMKLLDDSRLTLQPFMMTSYEFPTENYINLRTTMSDDDHRDFPIEFAKLTDEEYLDLYRSAWTCFKKYKLHESASDLEMARKRMSM